MSAAEASVDVTTAAMGAKRPLEADVDEAAHPHSRPRIGFGGHPHKVDARAAEGGLSKSGKPLKGAKDLMNEKYVEFVGQMMYPKGATGPFGFQPEKGRFPVERFTSLGYLLSPLRAPSVMEKWSPLEIAIFEAAIALHGKIFHALQKHVKTKTVKEVIEFYYEWKKTPHYLEWKKSFVPDERDFL